MKLPTVSSRVTYEGIVEAVVRCENLQVGIQQHKRLAHRFHDVLGIFTGILDFRFQLLSFSNIFQGQEDYVGADVFPEDLPGVEQDNLSTDIEEIMLDFVAVEHGIVEEDFFKEYPQFGKVPLAVTEVVDEIADCFFARYL